MKLVRLVGFPRVRSVASKVGSARPPSNSSFAPKFGKDSATPYAGEQIRPDLGRHVEHLAVVSMVQADLIAQTIYNNMTGLLSSRDGNHARTAIVPPDERPMLGFIP
jgi:hypothetical protein